MHPGIDCISKSSVSKGEYPEVLSQTALSETEGSSKSG